MGFSDEWENLYSEGRGGSIWPWSDLVSYVMRYARPKSPTFKVLELGCGAGANIPFFLSLGVQYYGIEGSSSVIKKIQEKHPQVLNSVVQADFTNLIPFSDRFDLIVDRASLTHNSSASIKKCVSLIQDHLVSGGHFIGIDWFSTSHSDFALGDLDGDEHTKNNIRSGQFAGMGRVHFSDEQHIADLFNPFEIKHLEHKIIRTEIPANDHVFASWNFVAQKK